MMRKKIVLFGHGGSYNHGCEAIVRSTVKILKLDQNTRLYTNSIESDKEFELDRLVALKQQRIPFHKYNPVHIYAMVMKKYFKNDNPYLNLFFSNKLTDIHDSVCISIGGDMYCYGKLSWLYYIHGLFRQNQNQTVLWGCSVDENSFFKESKEDLQKFDLIITRESISYDLLIKNGIQNVKLYPDPAFVLDLQEAVPPFAFEGKNAIAINISPLMNRYKGSSPLDQNVSNLIQHILSSTTLNIVFLPHVNGGAVSEDDYTYLNNIAVQYKDNKRVSILGKEFNCMQLKYFISKCRFLITARTHASIAAYSTGVPTVVLGYSIKSRGIAKDIFGTEKNYVIPVNSLKSEHELIDAFEWLKFNEEDIKTHLIEFMPGYQQRSMDASKEICSLANKED